MTQESKALWSVVCVGLCALLACADEDGDVAGSSAGEPFAGANGDAADSRFVAPQFPGAGAGSSGGSIGAGLETVGCGNRAPALPVSQGPAPGEQVSIVCFYGDGEQPAASIEWIVESAADDELVHIRLTLDPTFADYSYGETQLGWGQDGAKEHKL
jgi:hypothetical protein